MIIFDHNSISAFKTSKEGIRFIEKIFDEQTGR
jgi:hypothetical protein